ncbi:MBL fold metallo-hydrolase [Kordiimonas aquimaris]|uniref:MBL fold metallo-hydrolase n=1 Tax=Kordiimonas aquimaris TaxID=707591 RepID=UPI0021D11ECF|nr:MBL fold metallo-hydrolase [Kordiimonas aquimaris]
MTVITLCQKIASKWLLISLNVLVFMTPPTSADPFIPTFEELAPGVWVGIREDNPRNPVMGTATFVISDTGVVVYDGGGLPLFAERVIKKIRSLTDKPVTHVAISHWHGDHNFGIHPYLEAFPNVQVISHKFTHEVFNSKRIRYIDNYGTDTPNYKKTVEGYLETGKDRDGDPLTPAHRKYYQTFIDDADIIHADSQRVKITQPTITFEDKLSIISGNRTIEFLYLGDGNTAGDIVMWLPKDKIVATGDIVVHPVPYLFNVPPRKWAATMANINALGYEILVPGHGDIQRDTSYVDLLIELSNSIADQRDTLLAEGLSEDEAKEKLDFSAFENRFTGGDPYLKIFFEGWAKQPFSSAVFKALKGIPMVEIIPEE